MTTTTTRRAAWSALGVVIAALVVVQMVAVAVGAYTALQSRSTLSTVKSCTTPGGSCYQRGQENTRQAVGDIGQITVLAAACAASLEGADLTVPARAARIQACIVDQLDASGR